jgi:23S rRNA (cytosine1962-C5)-methyltransferase
VHRLDADVGGAWLIALSKRAAGRLSESFARADVQKEYRAITPKLPWREGHFRAGIDGKPAETIFQVVARDATGSDPGNPNTETCEVSLTLVTGRTHQLRRHLAGARYAILGDSLYGGVMVEGGLRLYSRSIAIENEGVHAVAPEPSGFQVSEAIYAVSTKPAEITVSHATAVALGRGHPWVLTDTETSDVGGLRPGSLVRVRSARGKQLAECRIEGPGRIAARVWAKAGVQRTNSSNSSSTSSEISSRVRRALERRAKLLQGISSEHGTTAFRLVHGEADALPGLMIDRVGEELRVLSMWRGSEAFERDAIDAVIDALGGDPAVVMIRNFADCPKGQFLSTVAYRGDPNPEPFTVKERGLLFEVDTGLANPLRSRPGFGLYIDQRSNRDRITKLIRRVGGGRWLNLFCHTGAFSIAALKAGADEVTSVDLSRPYLKTLERNLELNAIDPGRHTPIKLDVQRFVEKWSARDRFDGIILDPPTAAAAGKQFWSVRKGQAQLVEQCLSHLTPNGTLLVCRNDHGAKETLRDLVNRAAAKGGIKLRGVDEAGPGTDFPELAGFREGDAFDGIIATRA